MRACVCMCVVLDPLAMLVIVAQTVWPLLSSVPLSLSVFSLPPLPPQPRASVALFPLRRCIQTQHLQVCKSGHVVPDILLTTSASPPSCRTLSDSTTPLSPLPSPLSLTPPLTTSPLPPALFITHTHTYIHTEQSIHQRLRPSLGLPHSSRRACVACDAKPTAVTTAQQSLQRACHLSSTPFTSRYTAGKTG